ncbi:M23 family metallopeptidase [Streptomyces sp. NPDC020965]|uniref:M23 family metallopeptidase n=1 Tax=Streptomyces sp. NPDC020965 TaxID=3365105 RepID=UPI0037AE1121
MASNSPAPEAPPTTGVFSEDGAARSTGEWNPTADTVPVRGRHRQRVMKQRGGFARSSTVLGVGVIAAVGAGGIATAQNKPAVSISLPDVGAFMSTEEEPKAAEADEKASFAAMGLATQEVGAEQSGTGEALRSRILLQAEQQQTQAAAEARAAAERAAEVKAKAEAEKKAKEKAKAAAEAKKKAEAEAAKKAEAERLAKSYTMPLSSYLITATYGQSGSSWSSGQHTGLDFSASAGTPLKAVGSGTIKSAGYSGSYGYRVVLELNDGTEIWYAHLSSMSVGAGQKVATGENVGRVGSTGNSSGDHLHMEVFTPGGSPMNPMAWLRSKNLNP